jgi:hypothetical protein
MHIVHRPLRRRIALIQTQSLKGFGATFGMIKLRTHAPFARPPSRLVHFHTFYFPTFYRCSFSRFSSRPSIDSFAPAKLILSGLPAVVYPGCSHTHVFSTRSLQPFTIPPSAHLALLPITYPPIPCSPLRPTQVSSFRFHPSFHPFDSVALDSRPSTLDSVASAFHLSGFILLLTSPLP